MLLLRQALAQSGWIERTESFAKSLRRVRAPGELLLVGTPEDEPWHLAAHLDDEARHSGLAQLRPTLVRWNAPPGAPEHLAVTMARLEQAGRGETVFVVAPTAAPDPLLERVADARRIGATVLSIDSGEDQLDDLAHDRLVVPRVSAPRRGTLVDIDGVSHLVSLAAGAAGPSMSLRERVARFIEKVSGPAPTR